MRPGITSKPDGLAKEYRFHLSPSGSFPPQSSIMMTEATPVQLTRETSMDVVTFSIFMVEALLAKSKSNNGKNSGSGPVGVEPPHGVGAYPS